MHQNHLAAECSQCSFQLDWGAAQRQKGKEWEDGEAEAGFEKGGRGGSIGEGKEGEKATGGGENGKKKRWTCTLTSGV